MISMMGRIPPKAAPMPAPTKADSESGVSRIRSGRIRPEGPCSRHSNRRSVRRLRPLETRGYRRATPFESPRESHRGRSCRLLRVDKTMQVFDGLQGACFGERDRGIDLFRNLAFEFRHIHTPCLLLNASNQGRNGISLLPFLHFRLVAIQLGVVHGMGAKPVRAAFKKIRALSGEDVFRGGLGRFLYRQHIHPIRRAGGDTVTGSLLCEIGDGVGEVEACAHGVPVVLTDKQNWTLQQGRQIHALVELAFGHRAVSKKAARQAGAILQLVGKRQPDRHGQPASYHCISPVKPLLCVEKMHRSAAPAAAPLLLTKHLGHDGTRRQASSEGVSMFSIGGYDRVFCPNRLHHTDTDRLLSYIEVQKTTDLLLRIQLGALLLETPDQQHLTQQVIEVAAIGHAGVSNVDKSPSGSPSSRAFSKRRMILPLRVRGTCEQNSISLGAIAAPSFLRAKPINSRRSWSLPSCPGLRATKAFTISPIVGSGFPITPASATAGCSSSALSTSNGPTMWPAVLMMSSARPTNVK